MNPPMSKLEVTGLGSNLRESSVKVFCKKVETQPEGGGQSRDGGSDASPHSTCLPSPRATRLSNHLAGEHVQDLLGGALQYGSG